MVKEHEEKEQQCEVATCTLSQNSQIMTNLRKNVRNWSQNGKK